MNIMARAFPIYMIGIMETKKWRKKMHSLYELRLDKISKLLENSQNEKHKFKWKFWK